MADVALLALGVALLVAGGELLVRGASRVGAALGITPLVIGLTVVAFGTSAPELAVSLQAALGGTGELAVGNVVGSNIFNVLFILGVSALLLPLLVTRRIVRLEVPIMVGVSALAVLLALDGRFGRADGLVLLAVMAGYLGWMLSASRGEGQPDRQAGGPGTGGGRVAVNAVMAVAGLGLLVLGARWLVSGAVAMAARLGVPDVVIGLTIVAAGTSLPEVATSIVAALRGERDLAVGNVIGSNVFNLTVILGTTAVVGGPLAVAPSVLTFDLVVMTAVAVACLPIFFTGHCIDRWEGGLLLAYYGAYTVYLVLDATDHQWLPEFANAMRLFALPLTAVTLLVLAARSLRRPTRPGGVSSR